MPVNEKKIFRLYRALNVIAVGICLYFGLFVSPLKEFILPHLRKFVTANIDSFINILWLTFITGSISLVLVSRWISSGDKSSRSRAKAYISKLVAKDYYKGNKKVDFYKAVKTSLSKYSRQVPGEEDLVDSKKGSDVVTSDADKLREKFQDAKTRGIAEEEEEDTSDGTHKSFYPNGTLKKEVTYKDGKMEGAYRTFYEDGTQHQEKFFKEGLLDGVFKAYDEFGIPYFEITYKDGVKHGIESGYYKTGVIEYQEVYENGVRITRNTFDENGDLKFRYTAGSFGDDP